MLFHWELKIIEYVMMNGLRGGNGSRKQKMKQFGKPLACVPAVYV